MKSTKRKSNTQIALLFFNIILLFCLVSSANAQYAVGDTVDNFTLNSINNTSVSLYDYQGDVILLNFFATW